MKTALQLLFLGTLFLASCSSGYKLANTASNSDVYASGSKQEQTESYTPQESTNPNITDNSSRAEDYSEKRVDEEGDTYVTNNYNGNNYSFDEYDEDYYYSRHLRRWYQPYSGFSYYSSIYSDPYYWWGPTYYSPGLSITFGVGSYYPWYWHSHHHHHSHYYDHYYPWYSGYPYYGYNPYGYYYPYSYGYGYNNGYANGYYDGYWGNPYGNYYSDYYGYGNGYGNNGWYGGSNTYYGHHSSLGGNTNSTVEADGNGGRLENVKPISTNEVDPATINNRTDNNTSIQNDPHQPVSTKSSADKYTNKPETTKDAGFESGRPNQQTKSGTVDPNNTHRAGNFDVAPSQDNQQPHKGSTTIDVNPNTQIKPQPEIKQNQEERTYQWDHPSQSEPRQPQQQEQTQPRNNSYDYQAPREQSETPRSYESPKNHNYETPRENSWSIPESRPQEQPRYETPKQQQPKYEAPRSQTQVEQPREQKSQPSYSPPSRNNDSRSDNNRSSGDKSSGRRPR